MKKRIVFVKEMTKTWNDLSSDDDLDINFDQGLTENSISILQRLMPDFRNIIPRDSFKDIEKIISSWENSPDLETINPSASRCIFFHILIASGCLESISNFFIMYQQLILSIDIRKWYYLFPLSTYNISECIPVLSRVGYPLECIKENILKETKNVDYIFKGKLSDSLLESIFMSDNMPLLEAAERNGYRPSDDDIEDMIFEMDPQLHILHEAGIIEDFSEKIEERLKFINSGSWCLFESNIIMY